VAGSIGGMAFSGGGVASDRSVDSTRNGDVREVVWNSLSSSSSLLCNDEWYCFRPLLREFVLMNSGVVGRGNGSASHDVELVAIGD